MSLLQELRDSLSSAISWPADYFAGWFGVAPAESGVEVNELTAYQIASFYGCVRLISGTVSCTPMNIYERTSEGVKLATDHPLQGLLGFQPNPEVTAADLYQTGQGHLLTTGNCFIEIAYNNAGQPGALYLRSPYRTIPYRYLEGDISKMGLQNGDLFYKTTDTPTGYERIIKAQDMVHVKNFGMDSLVGLSPVKYYAREVLGNDLAAQSYSARYFANSSSPDGYLKTTATLSGDKKKEAAATWMAGHSRGHAHSMTVLDAGWTWEKVGVAPEEAQFIQTRGFNAKQIATIFGVPMHFLGESEQSRANMEQRSVEFLIYTMQNWYTKWEQALNSKLFPSVGRNAGRFFCKFDTRQFERATFADLLKGIQIGRFAGILSMDEGRDMLGLQPYTKEQLTSNNPGDKVLQPVNMVVVSEELIAGDVPPAAGLDAGGQGGGDQDGGDGGGKPATGTPQGGKRKRTDPDAEIKRYFLLFYPTFRDALGRIANRNKPTGKDFQKAFGPVLTQVAAAFSFRADADDQVLREDLAQFVHDYIAAMSRRGAKWQAVDGGAITDEELKRALTAIREKCAVEPPEDEPEEEEEDDKRHIVVNVAAPIVNVAAPQPLARASADRRVLKAERQQDGSVAYLLEESSTRKIKALRDSEGNMIFETEGANAPR